MAPLFPSRAELSDLDLVQPAWLAQDQFRKYIKVSAKSVTIDEGADGSHSWAAVVTAPRQSGSFPQQIAKAMERAWGTKMISKTRKKGGAWALIATSVFSVLFSLPMHPDLSSLTSFACVHESHTDSARVQGFSCPAKVVISRQNESCSTWAVRVSGPHSHGHGIPGATRAEYGKYAMPSTYTHDELAAMAASLSQIKAQSGHVVRQLLGTIFPLEAKGTGNFTLLGGHFYVVFGDRAGV